MANKQTVNVGLLGLGTVGSGVVRYFHYNQDVIDRKAGVPVRLLKAATQSSTKERKLEASLLSGFEVIYQDQMEDPAWRALVKDKQIDIIVELMGSPASRSSIQEALWAGKHVVTANKKVISTYGIDLVTLAGERGRFLRFEAAVGGGTPLIQPLDEALAGSKITQLAGIINGTTNFILSCMTQCGDTYHKALEEAREERLAEGNPTEDVEGEDARSKLKILIMMAFGVEFPRSKIYCRGIAKESGKVPVIADADITYVKRLGYFIKLMAVAQRVDDGMVAWVQPMLVSGKYPLAAVDFKNNAVLVRRVVGDKIDEVMFSGVGAGAEPTAGAVIADVIHIAREIVHRSGSLPVNTYYKRFEDVRPLTIDSVVSRYYLRFTSRGGTEILARIVSCLAKEQIAINSIEIENEKIFMLVGPTTQSRIANAYQAMISQTKSAELETGLVDIPIFD